VARDEIYAVLNLIAVHRLQASAAQRHNQLSEGGQVILKECEKEEVNEA
jgi:hypothetical protein